MFYMKKHGVSVPLEDNNFLGYKVIKENGFLETTTKYGCESDWHDLDVYSTKLGILIQWNDNKAVRINGNIHNDYTEISEILKSFILIKKQLDKANTFLYKEVFSS